MANLGLIPDWQFSANPKVNPMVNPHVTMPKGMYQAGVYAAQPNFDYKSNGLGFVMIDEGPKPVGVPWGLIREGAVGYGNLRGPVGFVDTWAWKHRKGLILAAVGTLGVLALTLAGSILR